MGVGIEFFPSNEKNQGIQIGCPDLLWSGLRGSNSLPGIPRMARPFAGTLPHLVIGTRFAQVEAASSPVLRHIPKRIPHPVGWGILFGAGDEARTRYLDLGKVALYQMSYARKRKIDYTRESRICQPLRSTFFNFFSKEFR